MRDTTSLFTFTYNRTLYQIPYHKILYFESRCRKILLFTMAEVFTFYGKLSDLETQIQKVNPDFLRIHQSFLVNIRYIKEAHYTYVRLWNRTVLNISECRQKHIRLQLHQRQLYF